MITKTTINSNKNQIVQHQIKSVEAVAGKIRERTVTVSTVVKNWGHLIVSNDGPSADIRPSYAWVIVGLVFVISGSIANSQIQSGNFISFLFVGGLIAMPFWITLTDSGAEWFMQAG